MRAFLLVAAALCASPVLGQDDATSQATREVEIVDAGLIRQEEINGETVVLLEGNVHLRQEETELAAERAVQYKDDDLIEFTGGVRITDEGDTLWADRIAYKTNEKLARGFGEVRWTDGQVDLAAERGEYFVDEKIAHFFDGVVMRDSVTTVTSEAGEYRVESETAVFVGRVRLDQETVVLLADSVEHDRKTGLTAAFGDVTIFRSELDSETRILLKSERAESDRESGLNRLSVNPVLVRLGEGGDTLVVVAERLEAASSDTSESFQAVGGARIWGSQLAGLADSVSYVSASDSGDGQIALHGRPVIWSGGAQVTGDTIRVDLADGSPTELRSRPNAFVAFEDSASGRIQQIKGNALTASFSGDSLSRLVVHPQAEALYFGEPDASGKESVVEFSGSSITLSFAGGDVGRIVASTDVSGEIKEFDGALVPALSGFAWRAPEQPMRAELLSDSLLTLISSWPGPAASAGTGSD